MRRNMFYSANGGVDNVIIDISNAYAIGSEYHNPDRIIYKYDFGEINATGTFETTDFIYCKVSAQCDIPILNAKSGSSGLTISFGNGAATVVGNVPVPWNNRLAVYVETLANFGGIRAHVMVNGSITKVENVYKYNNVVTVPCKTRTIIARTSDKFTFEKFVISEVQTVGE